MPTQLHPSSKITNFADDETSNTFVKRAGTTNEGSEYEDVKVAHMLINLLSSDDVRDFKVWSNDEKYGSTDDVIAIITKQNGDVMKIALQLKHSANNGKIATKGQLTALHGPFSLFKLFKDFQKACKTTPHLPEYILMLHTNKEIFKGRMRLGKDLVVQTKEVDDPVESLSCNNPPKPKCLKFTIDRSRSNKIEEEFTIKDPKNQEKPVPFNTDEFEKFLHMLYYCPVQPNTKATKKLCAEKYKSTFSSDKVHLFLDFVQEWSRCGNTKPKLSKRLVCAKLAESLLSPYILPLCPEPTQLQNGDLFLKAINNYDVTFVEKGFEEKLRLIWHEEDKKSIEKHKVNDFGLKHDNQDDLHKLLWHLEGRHLVVSYGENNAEIISKALNLGEKRKCVLVTDPKSQKPEDLSDTFRNFVDLARKDEVLLKTIGERLQISLEGKAAIPLRDVLDDETVRMCLTPSHFLQMLERPLLLGDVGEQLPEYYISRCMTNVTQVPAEDNNTASINLICEEPGMGKTWILKRMRASDPTTLAIQIEPKNHQIFDNKDATDQQFEAFLLSLTFTKSRLEKAVLKCLYSTKRVVILWDALDEAACEKLPNILKAIKFFQSIGLQQWITSRPLLRQKLEQELNMTSRGIARLDEKQQEDFIRKRLRNDATLIGSCETITKNIMKHLKAKYVNELFGIPLQLFMLTELVLSEDKQILESLKKGLFSIATLYQHFLDGKFNIHHLEKISQTPQNDQLKKILSDTKNNKEEQYEKAAMNVFRWFKNFKGSKLNFSCAKFLDGIEEKGDEYGIITSVRRSNNSDGKVVYKINFAHQTYAEFLAARYLTKNHEKVTNLDEYLFYETYNNIRFFFDVMMAENSELHLAVLYKDVETVKRLEKKPDCKDRLGRNPLTLAALQGIYDYQVYQLSPNAKEGADDLTILPPQLPKDVALEEISLVLKGTYEVQQDDLLLSGLWNYRGYDDSLYKDRKELHGTHFERVPGPSFLDSGNNRRLKLVAVSTIHCLRELATNSYINRMESDPEGFWSNAKSSPPLPINRYRKCTTLHHTHL